ncbi:hypothetical protein F5Y18DRAFT_445001 [Xylariaceae sp. FL1019]|nr:hypothetical protein F5Y18DRAFT_445001 [Xylariaceae sp. FL1019]
MCHTVPAGTSIVKYDTFCVSHPPPSFAPPMSSQPQFQNFPSQSQSFQSQYGNPQSEYGNTQSDYGNFQSQYNAQSQYGSSQSRYGNPQSEYGNPQSEYGNPQSEYGNSQSQYNPQSQYGSSHSQFGTSQNQQSQFDNFPNPLFQAPNASAENSRRSPEETAQKSDASLNAPTPRWDPEAVTPRWDIGSVADSIPDMPDSVAKDNLFTPRMQEMTQGSWGSQAESPFHGPSAYIQGQEETPTRQPETPFDPTTDDLINFLESKSTANHPVQDPNGPEAPEQEEEPFNLDSFNSMNPVGTPLPDLTPQYLAWIDTILDTSEFDHLINDASLYAQTLISAVPGQIPDVAFVQLTRIQELKKLRDDYGSW